MEPITLTRTACGSFHETRLGFIGQTWVNMYNNLRNMHLAIQPAVDNILASGFIDDAVTKSTSQPLPIPKSTLLKLVKLSLMFVPSPAGPALAAFRTSVKGFTKLANRALNNAVDTNEQQEENIANQPTILRDLLNRIPSWVKEGLEDQNRDIFLNTHPPGGCSFTSTVSDSDGA
jgi:hypothetical protein